VGGGKKQELGSWKISSGRRNFNCRADWLRREARLREEEKKDQGGYAVGGEIYVRAGKDRLLAEDR
jgi:hypothetical protein